MKILVAIIAYDEADNISAAIADLQAHNFGFEIVVIDNGSTDETAARARESGVEVVSHCVNSGSSAGTLMSYFMYAHRYDFDVLCQFDGDGQHIAAELPKIIDPIRANQADYVIGSRFIEKEGFQSSFVRRLGIRLFAQIDSVITGQKITDITSGFRAYGRSTIDFFARYHRHEVYDTNQLLLLSHFSGARILEVPVVMQERLHGESEFNLLNSISFPIKGFINLTGCILQKNQVRRIQRDHNGT